MIAATLGRDGLVRRYHAGDGLGGGEGAFLAWTFWLAECLARQGRLDQTRTWIAHAATINDLALAPNKSIRATASCSATSRKAYPTWPLGAGLPRQAPNGPEGGMNQVRCS